MYTCNVSSKYTRNVSSKYKEKLKKIIKFQIETLLQDLLNKKFIYFQNISTFHLWRDVSMFITRLLLKILSQLFGLTSIGKKERILFSSLH